VLAAFANAFRTPDLRKKIFFTLAILAIFATFAWQATASLVDGEARLSAEAKRWQRLDAVFARLDSDVRPAVPRPIRVAQRREPAFVGATSQAVVARVVSEDPRALRSIRPDVPKRMESALRAALTKQPEGRPESGAALMALLA